MSDTMLLGNIQGVAGNGVLVRTAGGVKVVWTEMGWAGMSWAPGGGHGEAKPSMHRCRAQDNGPRLFTLLLFSFGFFPHHENF